MKKIIVLTLFAVASFSTLKADDENISNFTSDKYAYLSLGGTANLVSLPGLYQLTIAPCVGVGFRAQSGHNGLDLSVQTRYVCDHFRIKGNSSYLYYFSPNLQDQIYCGIGAGIDTDIEMNGALLLTPELSIGKQFVTDAGRRRFWNVQFSPCAINRSGRVITFSELIVKYGLGF